MSKYHHVPAYRNLDLICFQKEICKHLIEIPYQYISINIYIIAKGVLS